MAIGMKLPFVCGDTSGYIIFLDKKGDKMLVERVINGSTNCKKIWVLKTALLKNNLSRSVFNEIAFTCPDLLQYFINKEDAYQFTKTSQNSSLFMCPVCGHIKSYTMAAISSLGFKCDKCSDKSFKYPNKFMMSLLDQTKYRYLTEVTKTTKGYEGLDNYRYDFLVFTDYGKYFVALDGYFHYNDNPMNGRTAEEQKKIDTYKDDMARKYGYKVIRINCCYRNILKRYEFIKNNVVNSEIMKIVNIDEQNIDWSMCDKKATSNILYEICDCWNSGIIDTNEIAKIIGVSWSSVYVNLNKGTELGLCNYNSELTKNNKIKKAQLEKGTPIKVSKDGKLLGVFISMRELSRQSLQLFGKHFNNGNISYACRKITKTCYGYQIEKITYEEYERFKKLNSTTQNECNLKEAI